MSTSKKTNDTVLLYAPNANVEYMDRLKHQLRKRDFDVISIEDLKARGPEVTESVEAIATIARFSRNGDLNDVIRSLPRLRIVSFASAGYEGLDEVLCREHGIQVGNVSEALSDSLADYAIMLMLGASRAILQGIAKSKDFEVAVPRTTCITGGTIGIVGMGHTGYKVARRARSFDMKILYHSRKPRSNEVESSVEASYYSSLDEMLPECDVIMITCSLTPATRGLIGTSQLKLMKKTSVLVNVARGAIVDTNALTEALETEAILAAGLDVTDPEPLPREHPLLSMPRALITGHCGGGMGNNPDVVEKSLSLTIDNIVAALKNQPLPCPVNLQTENTNTSL